MDGLENYYFQTQNQHAYSNALPCVSERKIPSSSYLVQLIPFSNLYMKFIMARHLLLSNPLEYTTLVLSRRYFRQQNKVEEIKKQKVQFFKEVAVPTKAKRLLTCAVTKICYAMLRPVNIWTGRRKIKQSKKLQKHVRPIKKLFERK